MKAAACGTWCGDFFTAWMVGILLYVGVFLVKFVSLSIGGVCKAYTVICYVLI